MKLKFFNSDLIGIKVFLINPILTNLLFYFFNGELIGIREQLASKLLPVSRIAVQII